MGLGDQFFGLQKGIVEVGRFYRRDYPIPLVVQLGLGRIRERSRPSRPFTARTIPGKFLRQTHFGA